MDIVIGILVIWLALGTLGVLLIDLYSVKNYNKHCWEHHQNLVALTVISGPCGFIAGVLFVLTDRGGK